MNPLGSLMLIGIAFVITTLLKHYSTRFATWSFGWLMLATWIATVFGFVLLASALKS